MTALILTKNERSATRLLLLSAAATMRWILFWRSIPISQIFPFFNPLARDRAFPALIKTKVFVGSDFFSWFFFKNFQTLLEVKIEISGYQLIKSLKSCPLVALKMSIFSCFQIPCQTGLKQKTRMDCFFKYSSSDCQKRGLQG